MRVFRFVACLCSLGFGLLAASQAALGADSQHRMKPFIAIGPHAVPSAHASPAQLFLFTCQLGLFEPDVACYDPEQMRHAYQIDTVINAGYTGAGRTIVIVDAFQSPTLTADVDAFSTNYALPLTSSGYLTQIAPDGLTPFDVNNADMVGWSSEISLDVQWAHAIAPNAKIVLVLAKTDDDDDILSAVKYAVNHNLGDVISMSFGENESCVDPKNVAAYHAIFVAAALKNITLVASSGDEGAAQMTCDGASWVRAASQPASDTLVLGVGGTELHAAKYCLGLPAPFPPCDPSTSPAPGTYQGEIAWNEPPGTADPDNSLSTGGGFSVLFGEPFYQLPSFHGTQRGVPDVAYSAAVLHGVLVRWSVLGAVGACDATDPSDCWFLFGGTSAGAPQWAGITALANQKAGHRLGFLNSAAYLTSKLSKTSHASFNDITSGNNSVTELDAHDLPVTVGGFSAGIGWDATTGLGTPIDKGLVDNLIRLVFPGDVITAILTTNLFPNPKPPFKGFRGPH